MYSNARYKVSNSYVFRHDWETDFFVLQRSGICYEIEIKVSRSDFFADFKKKDKHDILRTGHYDQRKITKDGHLVDPYMVLKYH